MQHDVQILGMGEVGLKFGAACVEAGLIVHGVDTSDERLAALAAGPVSVGYDFDSAWSTLSSSPQASPITVICVDTPIDEKTKGPLTENVEAALTGLSPVLTAEDLVIIRSTVPVAFSRTVAIPLLVEATNVDPDNVRYAFAPERATTSGTLNDSRGIHHLAGVSNAASATILRDLFQRLGFQLLLMESLEAAELGKLSSNAYRDISQAFANQLAAIAEDWGMDGERLIDEINLGYPRNRIKRPAPGVGGSCLTKDSYIYDYSNRLAGPMGEHLASLARRINDASQSATLASLKRHFRWRSPRVLVFGAAFKGQPRTQDTRGSVGLSVASTLGRWGWRVQVSDTYVPVDRIIDLGYSAAAPDEVLRQSWDAVLLYSNDDYFEGEGMPATVLATVNAGGYVYDPHHHLRNAIDSSANKPLLYRTVANEVRVGATPDYLC